MKVGDIFFAEESFFPLYRKGDKFKIIKINENPDLLEIEALHFKSKEIYGFHKDEIKCLT